MKAIKKMASIALAAIALIGTVGCTQTQGSNKTNEVVESVATAPDYSSNDKRFNMYAYVGPTNGKYTLANGTPMYAGQDFRTKERYQEYKDCGFDTLLLLGNDAYLGVGNYADSNLKMNLDLCKEVGLNCIVFDLRIHDLSARESSLIGTAKGQYATVEALANEIKGYMADYYDEEAFYGVTIKDEPTHHQFSAIGDVYAAFALINAERVADGKNELYINTVMLPYFSGEQYDNRYTANKQYSGKKAYRDYVQKYFTATGNKPFDYDSYPFKFTTSNDCANDPSDSYIETNYFSNLQLVAQEAETANTDFYLTMQSHASTAGASGSAHKRQMAIEDFRWQLNAAFAFGAKDLRYYTYWTFPTHTGDPMDFAIMSDTGEKQYYDMVQETNAEAQAQAKILLNFDYVQTVLGYDADDLFTYPKHFAGVKEGELDGVTFTSTCGAICNEMYDAENNRTGYYVFNAEDPAANMTAEVEMSFEGYTYVAVYEKGAQTLYKLNDGKFYRSFAKGEGAMIIPFN